MAMGEYMLVIPYISMHQLYIIRVSHNCVAYFSFFFYRTSALKSKKLLDDMAARGVKYIDCYGVDNVLVSFFLGNIFDGIYLLLICQLIVNFSDTGPCCRSNIPRILHRQGCVCCCEGCKEGIAVVSNS